MQYNIMFYSLEDLRSVVSKYICGTENYVIFFFQVDKALFQEVTSQKALGYVLCMQSFRNIKEVADSWCSCETGFNIMSLS